MRTERQPENPTDLEAASEFAASMVPRADIADPYPAWYGWALREAYLAGLRAGCATCPGGGDLEGQP